MQSRTSDTVLLINILAEHSSKSNAQDYWNWFIPGNEQWYRVGQQYNT
jgi:hypothetical protein